jgi:hypothetical protein
MSKEDYSHWEDKRNTWFETMQLAEAEVSEISMKPFVLHIM